jgi:hypothetical protein
LQQRVQEHRTKIEAERGKGFPQSSSVPSSTTETLLRELREECEQVVSLIRRLEAEALSARERDDLLGELSAAVLHLHTHTQGLDQFLCEVD